MSDYSMKFGEGAAPRADHAECAPCGARLTATPCCPKCGEANPGWPLVQARIRGRKMSREKRLGGTRHV